MNSPSRKQKFLEAVTVVARWAMGLLFIYMGLNKALDPVSFLKLAHQYELVQTPLLLNMVAATLPWFEVFCGVLLVLGIAVRGSALIMIVMLVPFTAMVLKRALEIQAEKHLPFCGVRFNCGCGAGEVWICRKLLENFLLIVFSGLLVWGRGRPLSLRYSLLRRRQALPESAAVPA